MGYVRKAAINLLSVHQNWFTANKKIKETEYSIHVLKKIYSDTKHVYCNEMPITDTEGSPLRIAMLRG